MKLVRKYVLAKANKLLIVTQIKYQTRDKLSVCCLYVTKIAGLRVLSILPTYSLSFFCAVFAFQSFK